MSDYDAITNLAQTVRVSDPRLYQALMMLISNVERIDEQLNPLVIQSQERILLAASVEIPPTFTFSYTLPGQTLRLLWDNIQGARQYEIRQGNDWDTALFKIRTSSLQADLDPIPSGSYIFLLKTINADGVYSTEPRGLVVNIPDVSGLIITSRVIDNNVLLNWTIPFAPYDIDYYEVKDMGVIVGQQRGTFISIFENVGGTFEYTIVGIDIAGDRGPDITLVVDVAQPPDFQLQTNYISPVTGTAVGCRITNKHIIAPLNTTETWSQHFSTRSWNTIQDQVNAGYPIYAQPTLISTGTISYYEEIIDFGAIFNTNILSVIWNIDPLLPSDEVTVVVKTSVSTDGVTYSTPKIGSVQYYPSLRYLKLRLEFTSTSDKALVDLFNLSVRMDVKREIDSGLVTALLGDVGGTLVTFNKPFKDIDSITLTTDALQPIVAIYDFVDIPNPTNFKVYAFDSTGNRVTYPVSWKARGIM